MKSKLAVTGITCNSGRIFVKYLSENITQIDSIYPGGIRAVCRESSRVVEFTELLPKAEICKCDLTDKPRLQQAFEGINTIVHIAGIHWSREVFDAAVHCGVNRIITVHTSGIYSQHKSIGEEYRTIENYCCKLCNDNNVSLTILRPTMIYGCVNDRNIIKFVRMVDNLPIIPIINGGNYYLQPVHYIDLGRAIYDVLINDKQCINKDYILSGKEPVLLKDMFIEIGKNLGKKVHFLFCPFWLAYSGASFLYFLSFMKIDYREKVQRLCENRAFPHDEATISFGYNPRSFQEGIIQEVRDYIRFYK